MSVRPTVRHYDPSPKGEGRSDGPWAVQTPSDDPLGASYFSTPTATMRPKKSYLKRFEQQDASIGDDVHPGVPGL